MASASCLLVAAATVLLLALATQSNAAAVGKPFQGYIIVSRYNCDDLFCPDWELDVSRVDVVWRPQEVVQLSQLIPKSPVASMSFPVITAYDNSSRTFYTVGTTQPGLCTVWSTVIDNAVENATNTNKITFNFDHDDDVLTRVHSWTSGVLIGIFANGKVITINTRSGAITTLGNILPAPTYNNGKVTPASIMVNGVIYAMIYEQYSRNASVVTYDISTGRLSAAHLVVDHQDIGLMNFFEIEYIPDQNKLVLFSTGNFDQLLFLDPTTGKTTFLVRNLAESNMLFTSNPTTKSDDTLQTVCYDPETKILYFQVTYYEGDDDIGTTSLAMLKFPVDIPNLAISPYTFGTQGFFYVPVLQ